MRMKMLVYIFTVVFMHTQHLVKVRETLWLRLTQNQNGVCS